MWLNWVNFKIGFIYRRYLFIIGDWCINQSYWFSIYQIRFNLWCQFGMMLLWSSCCYLFKENGTGSARWYRSIGWPEGRGQRRGVAMATQRWPLSLIACRDVTRLGGAVCCGDVIKPTSVAMVTDGTTSFLGLRNFVSTLPPSLVNYQP